MTGLKSITRKGSEPGRAIDGVVGGGSGDAVVFSKSKEEKRAMMEKRGEMIGRASRRSDRRRALVIDDSDVYRRIHHLHLSNMGFEVEMAENGKAGMDKLIEMTPECFDLIILDLDMPEMEGGDLTRKAFHVFGDRMPPVLICTGGFDKVMVAELLKLGVRGYLVKPVSAEVLWRRVGEIFPDLPAATADEWFSRQRLAVMEA